MIKSLGHNELAKFKYLQLNCRFYNVQGEKKCLNDDSDNGIRRRHTCVNKEEV